MITLDSIVPIALIDKAEEYGACKEALDWFKTNPRTVKSFLRQTDFVKWFVLNVPVGRVYRSFLHKHYPSLKVWYKNGKLHRDGDKPAVVYAHGDQCWYKNGELHRDGDKPAIVYVNGFKAWYKNGRLVK